jgi:hypothetical protein
MNQHSGHHAVVCRIISAFGRCFHHTNIIQNKKAPSIFMKSAWVNDGARTHDPRYHKPML